MTSAGLSHDQLALSAIARIAAEAASSPSPSPSPSAAMGDGHGTVADSCRIMPLPQRLQEKAAQVAIRVNGANAPLIEHGAGDRLSPQERIAVYTTKYWGPTARTLTVSFMEPTPADLRARILSHMNAWNCGISAVETSGVGQIRISRGPGGYWSYLGTDNLSVPPHQQTMNLENFSMSTPESEFRRVVAHEFGHGLGMPHEHLRRELVHRIDRQKAYAYYLRCCGWPPEKVDRNVLTPLDDSAIMGTPVDQSSIMCYWIPGEITVDGRPIVGGANFSAWDLSFVASIYPRTASVARRGTEAARVMDWDPSLDVVDPVQAA